MAEDLNLPYASTEKMFLWLNDFSSDSTDVWPEDATLKPYVWLKWD